MSPGGFPETMMTGRNGLRVLIHRISSSPFVPGMSRSVTIKSKSSSKKRSIAAPAFPMLRPAPSFPRNAPARKLARRLRTTARQDTSWPSLSLWGIWGGFVQANSMESSSLDARPRSVGAPPGVKEKEGVSGARRLPFASAARIKFAGSDSEPCRIAAPSRTASRHHRRFLTLRPCGQTLAPRNPAVD